MTTLKLLLCFLILFHGPFAQAKVIALGTEKNIEDFKEFLIQNPSYQSLSSRLLNEKLNSSAKLLESKYKLAVKGLTLEDLKPSIFLFQEITDYPKNFYIFSKKDEKIISESYFRLSNLDRDNTDFWITKAIYFNPDYVPSSETFNPSIIEKFDSEHKRISSYFYKLNTKSLKLKHSQSYLNGLTLKDRVNVHPSTEYILQVYKEGARPYTQKLSGESLIKLKSLNLESYELGSCNKPLFYEPNLKKSVDAVFYSKSCIRNKSQNKNRLADNNAGKAPLFSSDLSKPFPKKRSHNNTKKSIFSKKKTWYYILGGAVLSGLVVSLSNAGDSRVRPVQHD